MTREELIRELSEAPDNILAAEQAALYAAFEVDRAKAALQEKQALLVLRGDIDGKNAEIRAAQMYEATKAEQEALRDAEETLMAAKVRSNGQQNRFAALRAIARLMVGEVE